jgi:S-methylmethionine-dependent homocysteine/selenocysteine methylase
MTDLGRKSLETVNEATTTRPRREVLHLRAAPPYDLRIVRYREALPQLDGSVLLCDGGMETTLLFLDGIDLPCFATFPLLERDDGREAVRRYFEPYFETARRHGAGFVLEANTWRANPAWGAQLGYSLDSLAEANRRCIAFAEETRAREEAPGRPIVISAPLGPEGDAYDPESHLTMDQAQEFHSWQAGVLADTTADLITGLTISYVEEAIGIVRAATAVGMPVVVSFTVETDGRLPSGQALAEAIDQVDRETDGVPAYFMINCAHPTHFLPLLDGPGPWLRIRGIRANASTMSHAELDDSEVLDDGDPADLARGYLAIRERLPNLVVLGGCCGTDHRHVASIADAWFGAPSVAA